MQLRWIPLGICGVLLLAAGTPDASAVQAGLSLKVKEYVVMGYQGITQELSAGKGPYLSSLLELLSVPPEKSNATIQQLNSLAKRYPNIMEFAEQVAMLQDEKTSALAPATVPPLPSDRPLYSGSKLDNALQHLTRGMSVTVYLQNGTTLQGRVVEYDAGRLLIRMAGGKSETCRRPDIRAIEAPEL